MTTEIGVSRIDRAELRRFISEKYSEVATNPELGFISANSWDINGAASAGLNTFWIQRSAAEVPEELGFQASAVVKAITDLAPLLRG